MIMIVYVIETHYNIVYIILMYKIAKKSKRVYWIDTISSYYRHLCDGV